MAARRRPDVHYSSHPQYVPAHLPPGRRRDQAGYQAYLHRTQRRCRCRALGDLEEKWGDTYPAMIRLWRNAWNEFIPFLGYDTGIRKVICSTNAIESLNARYRRAVRA